MADNYEIAGNLLKVELSNHCVPVFNYSANKDWVKFGEFNNYPDYLIELYNRNAIHGAIVKGKSAYVYGKGLCYNPEGTILDQARVQLWLENANRYESWNDVYEKICKYYELFNGFALQIIWDFKGRIAEVYCMEFSKLRRSKDGKKVYYCDEWVDDKGKPVQGVENKDSYKAYDIFNPNIRTGTQILYFKADHPSTQKYGHLYPIPEYGQCTADIETDIEITSFHFHNLKNGMFASALLSMFNGMPDDAEKKKIAKMFNYTNSGTINAGKLLFYFGDKGGTPPQLDSLTPDKLDKMFEQVGKRLQQNIFTGHRADPVLFGVMTEGSLADTGGSAVLKKWDRFLRAYVEGRQETILNQIKILGAINGVDLDDISVKQTTPAGIDYADPNISKFLSVDEVRIGLGLDPLVKSGNDEATKTNDALNAMSPLVATKVLETMTEDEIRALAGLLPKNASINPDGTIATPEPMAQINEHIKALTGKQWINIKRLIREVNSGKTTREVAKMMLQSGYGLTDTDIEILLKPNAQFSKFDKLVNTTDLALQLLELSAIDECTEDQIISEEFVNFKSSVDCFKFELSKKQKFDDDLVNDSVKKSILDILKGNPLSTAETIAKQLGIDSLQVSSAVGEMSTEGLVDGLIGSLKVTDKGNNTNVPTVETEVYTVYKYVTRSDAPEVKTTSRPFCKKMLALSRNGKVWTRDTLDDLTNNLGEDAWTYRGGFYTNPDDGETTPYCRHVWKAIVKSRTKKK